MDAGRALSELTRLSAEIEGVVIVDSAGQVTSAGTVDADRLARTGAELLEIAALVDPERTVDRVVVQVAAGAVFAVRDGRRLIVATTGPEPAAALVFHDLRGCLAGSGDTQLADTELADTELADTELADTEPAAAPVRAAKRKVKVDTLDA